MVDLGLGEYITQVPSTRYPVYTRGNAGEVWPEVAYPLTITLSRKDGEIASEQAAINAVEENWNSYSPVDGYADLKPVSNTHLRAHDTLR